MTKLEIFKKKINQLTDGGVDETFVCLAAVSDALIKRKAPLPYLNAFGADFFDSDIRENFVRYKYYSDERKLSKIIDYIFGVAHDVAHSQGLDSCYDQAINEIATAEASKFVGMISLEEQSLLLSGLDISKELAENVNKRIDKENSLIARQIRGVSINLSNRHKVEWNCAGCKELGSDCIKNGFKGCSGMSMSYVIGRNHKVTFEHGRLKLTLDTAPSEEFESVAKNINGIMDHHKVK